MRMVKQLAGNAGNAAFWVIGFLLFFAVLSAAWSVLGLPTQQSSGREIGVFVAGMALGYFMRK